MGMGANSLVVVVVVGGGGRMVGTMFGFGRGDRASKLTSRRWLPVPPMCGKWLIDAKRLTLRAPFFIFDTTSFTGERCTAGGSAALGIFGQVEMF